MFDRDALLAAVDLRARRRPPWSSVWRRKVPDVAPAPAHSMPDRLHPSRQHLHQPRAANVGAATVAVMAERPSTSSSRRPGRYTRDAMTTSPIVPATVSNQTTGIPHVDARHLGRCPRQVVVTRRTRPLHRRLRRLWTPGGQAMQRWLNSRGLPHDVLVENRIGADVGPTHCRPGRRRPNAAIEA